MSLKMSILGLVSYKEMSGYDIFKLFDGSLRYFFYAQQSQVYRELNQLKKDELVVERREEQTSRPSKKLFSITEKGREALYEWLMNFDEDVHFAQRLPMMSKIFFASRIPDEELMKTLKRIKELAICKHKRLVNSYSNINDFHDISNIPTEDFFYWEMTVEYGLNIFEMYINWANHCIAKLEDKMKLQGEAPKGRIEPEA